MQLKHAIATGIALGGATFANPSAAGICTLLISTPGLLGLSPDGYRLGSEESGGLPAILTVTSIGSSTVTVDAPSLTGYPAGYNPSGLSLEVAYQGSGLIGGVSQGYTTSQTNFVVPNLISAVALTVNNRAVTSTGFAAGSYQTRTVVTCS